MFLYTLLGGEALIRGWALINFSYLKGGRLFEVGRLIEQIRWESFVDESDFQNERKWYILSKNSQFEECSIVPLDINGSMAGISDFGEDIVSEAGSASGGISSHDGSKNDTDSDYNTELSIISTISSSFNRKKL